jgi:hypothetical protein
VFTNWWVYWKLEKKSFSNLREWWDIAKIKIKSITIEASKKVNATDDKIKALKNKLETLKDIMIPVLVKSVWLRNICFSKLATTLFKMFEA